MDLPFPLGPMRPYLRPCATVSAVLSRSIFPFARTVSLFTLTSRMDAISSCESWGAS